jgi:hypothetical protein
MNAYRRTIETPNRTESLLRQVPAPGRAAKRQDILKAIDP